MSAELYFRVLGPVRVELAGAPVPIGSPQRLAVLSLLLLNANQAVSMDRLTDALWRHSPPMSHRVQLQGVVSHLRRTLGASGERAQAPILTEPSGYRLRLAGGQTDVERFHRDVAAARDRLATGDLVAAADLLHTALAHWSGPAFDGVDCPVVRDEAARLDEARLDALEDRVETDLALGRHRDVIGELSALVTEHPVRERFRGQLMIAYTGEGRIADALAVFRETRERMLDELGVEPSIQLQQLYRAILTGPTSPHQADSVATHAYLVPRQLPPDVPGLVGRDETLAAAHALLGKGHNRLALTGPGGVGKTALALRLAHQLRTEYPDGQLYARLGGAGRSPAGPESVLARFLQALGVPSGGVPADHDERAALYRELLATRRVLVVLDDVADEAQLRPLLPAEARCAVLATSRRRLQGIDSVSALPLGILSAASGLKLLGALAGAERVDAEPGAAAEIVGHCGGLPLALKIAGTRLAARPNWSVGDLARRLGTSRGRLDWLDVGDLGLRASLTESYAVLGGRQRRLLRRLGLLRITEFPGWLAGALVDGDPDAAERALDSLVDVHLVEPAGRGVTGPRYRVHDLVHLLAGELAQQEPVAARRAAVRRVLDGWLDLAATADGELPHWYGLDPEPEPGWRAPEELRAAVRADPYGWLDDEASTLATLVRQAAAEGQPAWPLAQRMTTYLDVRGRYDDWAEVLADGLRTAEQAGDRRGVACMLGLLTDVEATRDRVGESMRYAERTVAAYLALVEDGAAFPAATEKAIQPSSQPELVASERALDRARHAEDPLAVGQAAFTLAIGYRRAGVHGDYLPLFEEAMAAFQASGARLSQLWTLKNLGLAHLKHGRFEQATQCLLQAGEIMFGLGGGVELADTTADIAMTYAAGGRFAEAEELTGEILTRARLLGHRWDEARALDTLGDLRLARDDRPGAIDAHLEALAIWRRLSAPNRVGRAIGVLTELCDGAGDSGTAALLRAELAALSFSD
ncbi:AfsR/SARP family transcriptional regulator [Amycolatopsis nigrescens]|uniref:AfsR/SARP family transcriptional regulator n=1 Tax=Amycolatopsis nigrescens TaxID=381445 RepID=UPI0003737E1B|nr:BTAD domain-containing putative transcriptional regulator [Amycolatopsis nigrescens]